MRELLQNVVDGLGPHDRLGVLVIEPDVPPCSVAATFRVRGLQ